MAEEEHLDAPDSIVAAAESGPAATAGGAALRSATRGAVISAALILLSRVTGLGRDMVITAVFGQDIYTDCFKAALQVPDLLFFLIAGGVLSSSFMPTYAEYRREHGEEAAWELCSVVLTLWTVFALVLVTVGEVFAVPLVRTLATPGPKWTPEQIAFVVNMTRIVLPAQIAFFTGGVLMGIQWVHRDFVIPGIGPTVYNVCIMAGGAIGGLSLGSRGVIGLVWGGLCGAFLGNLALQFYGVMRYRPRLRFSLNWRHPGAQRVFVLMLPVIFSLSMPQVDVQINKWFAAAWLPAGALSALDTAYRLMLLPVGVLGQGVATSFYATMTNLVAEQRMDDYRATVVHGLRQLAVVALPVTALLLVLRVPVVAVLFERGRFTRGDTLLVAGAMALYGLGIYFWCAEQLLGRAFYSLSDTRTPPWCGTVVTVIFIGLDWLLMRVFITHWGPGSGYLGLALATTIAAGLYAVALLVLLRRKVGPLGLRSLFVSMVKALAASAALAAVAWAMLRVLASAGTDGPLISLIVAGGAGVLAYAGAARTLGLEEATAMADRLLGRLRRG
ncbi:MAG: murein biosynthesis integral membrane protein MurJ [Armatimonadetes bacterium]|nr:murein biosynthesis integral membrane protein MurJ [Armatimonadota bacterium]